MDTNRVNILDEADSDHFVIAVAYDLQLKLFPAKHRLFYQNLSDHTGRNTALSDYSQLFNIVDQTATSSAHRISWTDDHRISKLLSYHLCLFNTVGWFALWHFNAETIHCILEGYSIFTTFDRINLNT